eukprot:TRINITY_DN2155_c1_g3_i1.p1 TRINITY_DN2155_c1_g3~~TRINITY_DN2155_c1_g3_i1.p1  ORF type:complete len:127 (-),score=18.27 TRINITY_DN2155_c1_g3_i1:185-565(-)
MDNPNLIWCIYVPVALDEQPNSALTTLRPSILESGVNLEDQDEWKSARNVVWGPLDDVADEWEWAILKLWLIRELLRFLCLVAMKCKHLELHSMLTKCDMTPRKPSDPRIVNRAKIQSILHAMLLT